MGIDNMIKFILDAMQGIVYENDKLVKEVWASKYEGNPQTIIDVGIY
jgi:Holliday junction resolvase RusA-like endonuclease